MSNVLVEKFNEYFELVPADTEQMKLEVYHLRYQVYCLETGFENPEEFSDTLEKDEYDNRSDHYLVRHKRTGEYVATTRFILPDGNDPRTPFPIELHCAIDRGDLLAEVPREDLAEISRFCVSKKFKKRQGELGTLAGITDSSHSAYSEDERRAFPYITLGLIACLIRMTAKHGIGNWYAVMEPALIRFLSQIGINFSGIGPVADYHGKRLPCVIKVDNLLEGVKEKSQDTWEFLTDFGRFPSNTGAGK